MDTGGRDRIRAVDPGLAGLEQRGRAEGFVGRLAPTSSSSAPYTSSPTDGVPDDSDTGEGSADEPEPEPDIERSIPAPDPTEKRFEAISVGDCLAVYDTGRGGTSVDWSVGAPPDPVSCAGEQAQVQVTSIRS